MVRKWEVIESRDKTFFRNISVRIIRVRSVWFKIIKLGLYCSINSSSDFIVFRNIMLLINATFWLVNVCLVKDIGNQLAVHYMPLYKNLFYKSRLLYLLKRSKMTKKEVNFFIAHISDIGTFHFSFNCFLMMNS